MYIDRPALKRRAKDLISTSKPQPIVVGLVYVLLILLITWLSGKMSGLKSVDAGQSEAARSLGLSKAQCLWHVVMPQALKTILPALGNEFIMIIKDTSLASTFFIGDLMTQYLLVKGATYLPIEPLVIVGVIYFLLTFILSKLFGHFERKMSRGDK